MRSLEWDYSKRLWCWERLRAGREGYDRGWNGWMASLTQRTWVWVNSGSWGWTRRLGMLQSMGGCKESDTTEWRLNWTGYLGKFLARTNENESTYNKKIFIGQQLEKQWLRFVGPVLCASYLTKLVFPKFLKLNILFWISFKPTEKLQKQTKNSHISFAQRPLSNFTNYPTNIWAKNSIQELYFVPISLDIPVSLNWNSSSVFSSLSWPWNS